MRLDLTNAMFGERPENLTPDQLNAFQDAYEDGNPSEQWWRDNLDLDQYYSFRTILMAIHDYDAHAGKNYFYYHNPVDDRWFVINWDLDL